MNDTLHWCDDKDTLIDYLYGELDAEAKRVFEGHLRTCLACAHDVEELRAVRTELAGWQPPEAALGFTAEAVRAAAPQPPTAAQTATVLQPPQWAFAQVPVWARAAAAVLVIGAGLGLANLQVQYGPAGLQVSTGWMTPAAAPARGAAAANASAAGWRPELAALEADLRREMQTLRTSTSTTAPEPAVASVAARAGGDEQAILRRVQSLIQESERRQQQDLALRLRQFGSDVEMQRRADLVRLEQGFDRFQGRSGAAIAQQQRVLDLLVRASTTKVP